MQLKLTLMTISTIKRQWSMAVQKSTANGTTSTYGGMGKSYQHNTKIRLKNEDNAEINLETFKT